MKSVNTKRLQLWSNTHCYTFMASCVFVCVRHWREANLPVFNAAWEKARKGTWPRHCSPSAGRGDLNRCQRVSDCNRSTKSAHSFEWILGCDVSKLKTFLNTTEHTNISQNDTVIHENLKSDCEYCQTWNVSCVPSQLFSSTSHLYKLDHGWFPKQLWRRKNHSQPQTGGEKRSLVWKQPSSVQLLSHHSAQWSSNNKKTWFLFCGGGL